MAINADPQQQLIDGKRFIELSDFTPGIFGSWFSSMQSAPDGAAQVDGTWGCVASATGGIGPGPRLVRQYRENLPDDPSAAVRYFQDDAQAHILAFRNVTAINTFPALNYTFYAPNADITKTNMRDQAAGTANIFNSINEATLDTADFIESTTDTSNAEASFRFASSAHSSSGNTIRAVTIRVVTDTNISAFWYGIPFQAPEYYAGMYRNANRYTPDEYTVTLVGSQYWHDLRYTTDPLDDAAWTDAKVQALAAGSNGVQFATLAPVANFRIYQVRLLVEDEATTVAGYPDQTFYGIQWWHTDTATGPEGYFLESLGRIYKFWRDPVTSYDSSNVTTAAQIYKDTHRFYGYISADVTRTNKNNPLAPGVPKLAYAINPWMEQGSAIARIYPDPDSTSTDSSEAISFTNVKIFRLFCHQDRIFAVVNGSVEAHGPGANIGYESIRATALNDHTNDSGTNAVFVNENPSAIGAIHSSNANELLVMKVNGGGYFMRGDVLNPQITRLRALPAANVQHVPTVSRFGVVYGNLHGIYLWTGGDSAQSISDQFDYPFWVPPDTDRNLGPVGSFAYTEPYIFAPNAFYFNLHTASWWRLCDTTKCTYAWTDSSSSGKVLCAPPTFKSGDSICDWYDPDLGASEWQWTSQPLQITRGKTILTGELYVVAQGEGTITFTYTGLDDVQSEPITVNVNSERPKAYRTNCTVTAHDIVVTIHAVSAGPDDPAPFLNRALILFDEGATIADG